LSGDPTRLRQVLINLTGNAVKFTSQGHVLVRAESKEEDEETVTVEFSITDTGVGMDADQRGRLFQPFSQADGSTTRRFGGSGLGLSISQRLVQAMGGAIRVESEPGKGSRFSFCLRLKRSVETGPSRTGPSTPPQILVLEDYAEMHPIWDNMLALCDCAATVVSTAALAGALAERGRSWAAVLVVEPPGRDATPLLDEVRAHVDTPIPLIRLARVGRAAPGPDSANPAMHLHRPVVVADVARVMARVLFPAKAKPHAIGEEKQVAMTPSGVRRVLVVEDSVISQRVALVILQKLGHEVEVVSSGRAALAALGRKRHDIVFMDCQMPDMDGYEATTRFRKMELAGQRLPIVAMTASALEGDREKCLQAGMDDYLSKPVKPVDLARMIDRWTSGPRPPCSGANA
jgi:two-component system, sensor histidine kinase and response regulator